MEETSDIFLSPMDFLLCSWFLLLPFFIPLLFLNPINFILLNSVFILPITYHIRGSARRIEALLYFWFIFFICSSTECLHLETSQLINGRGRPNWLLVQRPLETNCMLLIRFPFRLWRYFCILAITYHLFVLSFSSEYKWTSGILHERSK